MHANLQLSASLDGQTVYMHDATRFGTADARTTGVVRPNVTR